MKRHIKRAIIDFLGWLFIIFGIVGIFVPILQGILFTIIGLYLLSLHSRWAHRKLEKLKRRDGRIAERLERFDTRVRNFLGIDYI